MWSLCEGSVLLMFVVLLLVHGVAHAVCDGFLCCRMRACSDCLVLFSLTYRTCLLYILD